nr:MAG TPA: hypothetical protein [Caudoviricetes sp.]
MQPLLQNLKKCGIIQKKYEKFDAPVWCFSFGRSVRPALFVRQEEK